MSRITLTKLAEIQNTRIEEIASIGNRMRERARDTLNKTIIQTRIDNVKDLWAEIRKAHHEINLRNDSNGHPYITENRFETMRGIYEETLDWLSNAFVDVVADAEPTRGRRRLRDDDDDDEEEGRTAKLPRLDLPTFDGKYEDWESFADVFTTLVHNGRPRIADTTKLQYLKSCLTGPAAELVKDVPILGTNYASTWKALRDRFYNPRLTINRLLDTLLDLPHLKKESAVELRAFADNAQRVVRALTNLRAPVAQWDVWLVHLLEVRLDPESRKQWEAEMSARDQHNNANSTLGPGDYLDRMPKFSELVGFMERRVQSLTAIQANKEEKKVEKVSSQSGNKTIGASRRVHHVQAAPPAAAGKCIICGETHFISQCPKFVAKKVYDRTTDVRHHRLCFNCLGRHKYKDCNSKGRCKTCRGKHHTLLHIDRRNRNPPSSNAAATTRPSDSNTVPTVQVTANVAQLAIAPSVSVKSCNASAVLSPHSILLATAQVLVTGPTGKQTRARVLLDQGSEVTFVSDALVQLLDLPRERIRTNLVGVGGCNAGVISAKSRFALRSRVDVDFQLEITALILPRLTGNLPSRNLIDLDLELFKSLNLADPDFHISDRVDILLGADLYGQLLRPGLKTFSASLLVAQNTALGWVVSGPTQRAPSRRAVATYNASTNTLRDASRIDELNETIERFWRLEEVPIEARALKPEDQACERFFAETHRRDNNGRFIVRLPLKSDIPGVAAETRRMAFGSLKHQQSRFSQDDNLTRSYSEFMDTYQRLGHMVPVPPSELKNPDAWYLPHHAVVTGDSAHLKTRVVFDASRQTREHGCLNDYLIAGPALQSDLALILLNWRRYRYVFTADIVKMFRQIRLATEDQDKLRVLWPPQNPIDWRLTTVTYGTSCAPFLAIRTLLQLAKDERQRFPLGAECLERNTYVDDTFAGADELAVASVALRKRDDLIGILHSAGIELDKWAANQSMLLPTSVISSDNGTVKEIEVDSSVKTLGVQWNPSSDKFHFTSVTPHTDKGPWTKRSVYSTIASLFDPLGWLAPITVLAKLMMQDLWIVKCDWDEPLPTELRERWRDYCHSLSALPTLAIDRWLNLAQESSMQIHGFSDASSRAYAAVVYLRVEDVEGNVHVSLLASKTKPAPIKTKSIPNLELCGAELLVKLVKYLRKLDFLTNVPVHLWSDSQIVLTWLKKHPCQWKTFVANRVSYIQTELPSATWSHVPTKQNPADLATRGVLPAELGQADLWWHGPSWLALNSQSWPQSKTAVQALHIQSSIGEPELLSRYSTLTRTTRVTAWLMRPLLQLRRRKAGQDALPPNRLTTIDLNHARDVLVRVAQSHAFPKELELVRAQKTLPRSSPLRKLKPTLGGDGILRFGGRLDNSNLPYSVKHPAIIPRHSALSRLYAQYAHLKSLHGGPTLTTSVLLRHVWILGMRQVVKLLVHKCVKCQWHKPRLAQQLMGNLPAARVTPPLRPFTSTGLDYAGPFQIRTSKGRGQRAYKGYIALFVCFATKAIHLEVVSDLTSATFIAAFRRFVSRRGLCRELYSDNATTFRGADAELRAMFNASSDFYKSTATTLANDGVSWVFIPPTTPHYGGLWEAGVKSTKHLLKRLIGEHTLTFEEFATVLAEIEACLNSRPMGALTSDIDDLQALTPSHYLIGSASGLIPDEPTPDVPTNRLGRFQLLQRIRDQFWKRWTNEYVLQMQERGKWREPTKNFNVGQLVLLKDDRYPTAKWPLGRVIETHPGPDGLVRVVTVKTATNSLRRHVACLAPLQLEQSEEKENLAKQN